MKAQLYQNILSPIKHNLNNEYLKAKKSIDAENKKNNIEHGKKQEELDSINDLCQKVNKLTSAAEILQKSYDSPFNKKNVAITTTDTEKAGEYLSVEITKYNETLPNNFDVKVNQVAVAARMTIAGANETILKSENNQLNGTLTITSEDIVNNIEIMPGDSIDVIISKINNSFEASGAKALATSLKTGTVVEGDRSYDVYNISISNKELGNKNLTFHWQANNDGNNLQNSLVEINNRMGQQAEICVNGSNIDAQDSNLFKNIFPGVNIKVSSANNTDDDLAQQTVSIVNDTSNSGVLKEIKNFIRSYNDLRIFCAEMTEKISETTYAEGAVLHGTDEIRKAEKLLNKAVFSISSDGKYKKLSDVGIELVNALSTRDLKNNLVSTKISENTPANTKILTINETKLNSVLENHYDDLTALFRGSKKILHNEHNLGSKLNVSPMSQLLDDKFYGQNMEITIHPGQVAGEVMQVDGVAQIMASIPGITNSTGQDIPIMGNYNRGINGVGYIDFSGTDLAGLVLSWDSKNLIVNNDGNDNNNPEIFTLNLSQSLIDTVYSFSNKLSDGKTNKGILYSSFEKRKDILEKEEARMTSLIQKKGEELEKNHNDIEKLTSMTDVMTDYICNLLSPNSSKS